MSLRSTHLLAPALFIGLAAALATPAQAAVPSTLDVYGTIGAQGGSAPDGQYGLTFALYSAQSGGVAVWKEGPSPVMVKAGRFHRALGLSKPLTAATLAPLKEVWLGVTVNFDPEQPRVRLRSVLFALQAQSASSLSCSGCVGAQQLAKGAISPDKVGFTYAGSSTKGGPATLALGLKCSGCVSVSAMKFDDNLDLGGNALKAKNAAINHVVAQSVVAGSFTGDGSKLTGIKTASGVCSKPGQVVRGINPDGSLICVASGIAGALPPDGIDEISNNLIFNQFVDSKESKGPFPIPDHDPIGIFNTIDFPDVGLAQKLTVHVHLTNSDLSGVTVTLYAPDNTPYTLIAEGSIKGTVLKTSFPSPTAPSSGDLTTWVGKNPKGKWRLKVTDAIFKNNAFDGAIESWRIDLQTLSSKKILIKGDLIVDGSVKGSKGFKIVGDTTFDGKVTFNDQVVFKKVAIFQGGISYGSVQSRSFQICDDTDFKGPCFAHIYSGRDFRSAAKLCAGDKGDICTDSQSTRMRQLFFDFNGSASWTNSFADNDGGQWKVANGGTGDNHSHTSSYLVPCCHNLTPTTPGEKTIGGVRLLETHNTQDATWDTATKACLKLKADLCDKGQYLVLREKGAVSGRMWASDHSDNDGNMASSSISSVSDDPNPNLKYGYACCATTRKTLVCPAGSTDTLGVCVAKIHDGGANWSTAANACASLGARLCSIAQTAVLRQAGKVKASASWTASYSDNDGNQASVGVGNAGDNHSAGSSYGYACCF